MKNNLEQRVVDFFDAHPREAFKSRQVATAVKHTG